MTLDDLLSGLMAAVSAATLTAYAILAAPAVRHLLTHLRRA